MRAPWGVLGYEPLLCRTSHSRHSPHWENRFSGKRTVWMYVGQSTQGVKYGTLAPSNPTEFLPSLGREDVWRSEVKQSGHVRFCKADGNAAVSWEDEYFGHESSIIMARVSIATNHDEIHDAPGFALFPATCGIVP